MSQPTWWPADNLSRVCLIAAAALWLVFFATLPTHYWSDSEIWGVQAGGQCFRAWSSFACSTKPLFNFLMALLHSILKGHGVENIMLGARIVTMALWIVTAILFTARCGPALSLLFASSTLLLFDANVARSDFWALPFVLIHFQILESDVLRKDCRRTFALIFSALIAVLMTPKALFSLLCFGPWYLAYFRGLTSSQKRRFFKILTPTVFIAALSIDWITDGAYFFRLFQLREYGLTYLDSTRFIYLFRTIYENPFLFICIGVTICVSSLHAVRMVRRKSNASLSYISGALLLLFLIYDPNKLPYWIGSQILLFLFVMNRAFERSPWLRRLTLAAAMIAGVNGLRWIPELKKMTNQFQVELVQALERTTTLSPKIKIYDSLGLTSSPGQELSPDFLGPAQARVNYEALQRVRSGNYDLILLTNKVAIYRQELAPMLAKDYITITPSMYLRAPHLHISRPKTPAVEIALGLTDHFLDKVEAKSSIAIIGEEKSWVVSQDEIGSLGPLCRKCKAMMVRLSPYGRLYTEPVFQQQPFYAAFAFESTARREFKPNWMGLLK